MTATDACLPQLQHIYSEQLAELAARGDAASVSYLRAHAGTAGAMLRQIQLVRRYLPHVRGATLDWGCLHAPDSCLLRMLRPSGLDLYGCDVYPPGWFGACHRFAGFRYQQLDHPWRLPYDDATFDTVIADGVLEHVPNDVLSLAEVYRVMRVGGRLIVCCLPNAWSYTEALARTVGRPHHLRAYTLRQARGMLLHSGFRPLTAARYQMVPTFSGRAMTGRRAWLNPLANGLWRLNGLLERAWPLNRLAANLLVVAEKVIAINWTPPERA